MERWEDLEHSLCYENIWIGGWEEYDGYNGHHRFRAMMDLYDGAEICGA